MRMVTKEEFDSFPVDESGFKRCGTGDYSNMKWFGVKCIFEPYCKFGDGSIFDDMCYFFGECSFGRFCDFCAGCGFAYWCNFGEKCKFGSHCKFDHQCSFGARCSFGDQCKFDCDCMFGDQCKFGNRCKCEFGEFTKMVFVGGFGYENQTMYFFLLTDGSIHVRYGLFSGTLEELEEKVKDEDKGTKIEKAYLSMILSIKLRFDSIKCGGV